MLESPPCDICLSTRSRPLFYGSDLELGLPGVFGVVQCLNCGHLFTSPRPDSADIARYYPSNYGPYLLAGKRAERDVLAKMYNIAFRNPLERVLLTMPKGRVLDYGTGSGLFLKEMAAAGWETLGLDFSEVAVESARSLGLNVLKADFDNAGIPDGYYDACTMFHVLEHLPRASETLRQAWRVLKPNGLLFISVPNAASIEAKIFGRFWFGFNLPRHLQHYTPDSISRLLTKCSFRVKRIMYDSSHIWLQTTLVWILGQKRSRLVKMPFSVYLMCIAFAVMLARSSPVIHIVAEKD